MICNLTNCSAYLIGNGNKFEIFNLIINIDKSLYLKVICFYFDFFYIIFKNKNNVIPLDDQQCRISHLIPSNFSENLLILKV